MIITLSGYMGAGKTALGRELARLSGWDFIDLDDFIAAATGLTPAQIIRRHGERTLRIAENKALNEILTERDRLILALGGGTLTEPFNRNMVDTYSVRVFVDTPWEHIRARLAASETDRPLWQTEERQARAHYEARLPDYRRARLVFRNDFPDASSAALALWELLQKELNLRPSED